MSGTRVDWAATCVMGGKSKYVSLCDCCVAVPSRVVRCHDSLTSSSYATGGKSYVHALDLYQYLRMAGGGLPQHRVICVGSGNLETAGDLSSNAHLFFDGTALGGGPSAYLAVMLFAVHVAFVFSHRAYPYMVGRVLHRGWSQVRP